jgi:hypothetical protein
VGRGAWGSLLEKRSRRPGIGLLRRVSVGGSCLSRGRSKPVGCNSAKRDRVPDRLRFPFRAAPWERTRTLDRAGRRASPGPEARPRACGGEGVGVRVRKGIRAPRWAGGSFLRSPAGLRNGLARGGGLAAKSRYPLRTPSPESYHENQCKPSAFQHLPNRCFSALKRRPRPALHRGSRRRRPRFLERTLAAGLRFSGRSGTGETAAIPGSENIPQNE